MKEYATSIEIDAPPERVWDILVDTARWPEFDPFCDRVEGRPVLGGKVTAFTKLAPGRGFPVTVAELDRPHRMVWSGGMPLGLFKGVRTYELSQRPGGGSHFEMREVFTGPMLALIGGSLPDMTEPFHAFAKGLKSRSENQES